MQHSRIATLVLLAAVAGAALPGCVGYNSYPPIEGDWAFHDPNSPPMSTIMTESVRWAAAQYPVYAEGEVAADRRFAINLPVGVRRYVYLDTVRAAGPDAVPMSPEAEAAGLPTYHVTRLWVRGDEGRADILKPIAIPSAKGGPKLYQSVTVYLRSGTRAWRVVSHRMANLGAGNEPEIYYIPDDGTAAPAPIRSARPGAPRATPGDADAEMVDPGELEPPANSPPAGRSSVNPTWMRPPVRPGEGG
ncbi:MAG: hypothetical protein JNM07_04515 [Phycisphaerae bacterium]|nr:hypothetical protein [Phycisphaerae bacterium]